MVERQTRHPQKLVGPGPCGSESRRPYSVTMTTGGIWQTRPALDREFSWFEARVVSKAEQTLRRSKPRQGRYQRGNVAGHSPFGPAPTRPSYGQAARIGTEERLDAATMDSAAGVVWCGTYPG